MSDDPQTNLGTPGPTTAVPAAPSARGAIPTSTVVVGALLVLVVGFGVGFSVGHGRGDRFGRSIADRHL